MDERFLMVFGRFWELFGRCGTSENLVISSVFCIFASGTGGWTSDKNRVNTDVFEGENEKTS